MSSYRPSFVAAALALLSVAACTQSSTPLAPSTSVPAPTSGASIEGTVTGAGSTRVSPTTAVTVAGLTVSVEGTDISAAVDLAGRFRLDGLPPGDARLWFRGDDVNARAVISNLAAREQIQVQVTLSSDTATIVDETRTTRPSVEAGIAIEMSTNGHDADEAPGPSIPVGETIVWAYDVTNTGNVALVEIVVEDDPRGRVECPARSLDAGESMTCQVRGHAEAGPHRYRGTVVAVPRGTDTRVDASDPSHYVGVPVERE